jgi:AcrR family transcriptional regulator
MSGRSAAVEETRRRILEATLELHTERGIFGTRWQDIARRADVSTGTVYRHFPTLADLVPACGELLMERTRPPSPDEARRVVGDAAGAVARLECAAAHLFAFYERAGASLDSDPRERQLPEVQEWEEYLRATVTVFVREALRGSKVSKQDLEVASALFDYRTYGAFRTRSVSPQRTARAVSVMVACSIGLGHPPRTTTREEKR